MVTTLHLNYEWRRLLSDALQSHADSLVRNLDDSLVDDYRNKFQAVLDDLYTPDLTSEEYRLRVMATMPLRYNRLNEGVGSTIVDSSGNAFTGTYTGITWDGITQNRNGDKAPFFDGVQDCGNLYSSSFASALNLDEITIMISFKMDAAFWAADTGRFLIRFQRSVGNMIYIRKHANANTLEFARQGNTVYREIVLPSQFDTGWVSLALSVSVAGGGLLNAGELKAYKNGNQIGSTLTGNIANAGSGLDPFFTVLGAQDSVTRPRSHYGWLSNLIIWNRPIDNEILDLMVY